MVDAEIRQPVMVNVGNQPIAVQTGPKPLVVDVMPAKPAVRPGLE